MAFGNASSNSYVFVGGLPSWYDGDVAGLNNVVLPTVLLEPRFRGAVRNLAYRDARMTDITALNVPYTHSTNSKRNPLQDLIAYKVSKFIGFRSANRSVLVFVLLFWYKLGNKIGNIVLAFMVLHHIAYSQALTLR